LLLPTFLIVRVVPIFGEIFKDFGAQLPAPTQFLIDLSEFVSRQLVLPGRDHWRHDLRYTRVFFRSKRGKIFSDRWKLKAADLRPADSQDLYVAFSRAPSPS